MYGVVQKVDADQVLLACEMAHWIESGLFV